MKRLSLFFLPAALAACADDGAPPCDTSVVGRICTIAGDGKSGYRGDDGPAIAAELSLPQDTLKVGELLYIIDWNNHRIRKLEPDGTIRHVAGRGELGGTLDDPANSDLNHPTGLVRDPAGGGLFVAAWHNSKVLRIDEATGEIAPECGDGRRAYFGDGGAALTASLDLPASLAFLPGGELVVMDQANQVLRKIDAAGRIERLAGRCVIDGVPPYGEGPCPPGVEPVQCPGQSGKLTCGALATCSLPCSPAYGGDDGRAAELRMAQPFGQSADPAGRIVVTADGTLYFADTGNAIIRKIDPAGRVTRIAGKAPVAGRAQRGYAGDGGPALEAQLNNPVDLALDADGTMYVSDVYNHCIRAIAPDGVISTVVGVCGEAGYGGDGGAATLARLKRPYGVEVADGVLYVADTGNHVVRSVRLR